jgi:hypothetical protein
LTYTWRAQGDATYLVTKADGTLEPFGVNAVCTHLGCVVPWNKAANKFCCPCHGSQYDQNGKVRSASLYMRLFLLSTVFGTFALRACQWWSKGGGDMGRRELWWSVARLGVHAQKDHRMYARRVSKNSVRALPLHFGGSRRVLADGFT